MQNLDIDQYYNGKSVLVTGGAGFVGSNLVHKLCALGAKVTVIDCFHPDYGGNPYNFEGVQNKITLHKADILDEKLMDSLVSQNELVFHAAAQCSHVDSMTDPWLDLKFNCQGTLTILEAVKKKIKATGKVTPVVYVSTRAVIGAPLQSPALETTLPNPVDVYGVNKMAAEYYGAVYARVYQNPYVSVRLTNSYGPRHQMRHGKYGILNWFISLALQSKTIKVFGTGEQLRDYLYIDDAVEALVRSGIFCSQLQEAKKDHEVVKISGSHIPYAVFNVASGDPLPFVACAKQVVETTKSGNLEMVPWPADRKAIETGDFVADCREVKKLLNWAPRTSFKEGLEKTVEFYRKNLNHYL